MLKDGQIVEQGSHSELLALNGEFAKMWAAQVQGAEDVPHNGSHQKEAVSGYSVEDPATKEGAEPIVAQVEHLVDSPAAVDVELVQDEAEGAHDEAEDIKEDAAEVPSGAVPDDETGSVVPAPSGAEHSQEATTAVDDQAPVAFPVEAAEGVRPSGDSAAAVAFPGSDTAAPVAFAFPGGDDAASQKAETLPEGAQTPGVTFQDPQSPPRVGATSPDPDGKRRRTLSTQGIQRFARRLSTSKRPDSVLSSVPRASGFIAALRREGTSTSRDDNSSKDAGDSPNASVSSEIGQAKKLSKKKEKKDKRKSTPGGI